MPRNSQQSESSSAVRRGGLERGSRAPRSWDSDPYPRRRGPCGRRLYALERARRGSSYGRLAGTLIVIGSLSVPATVWLLQPTAVRPLSEHGISREPVVA